MSKLILLYSTFIIGLVFMLVPNAASPQDYFLFSDMKLYPATYVYFIGEKLVLIVLAYVIASQEIKYREAVYIFFWLFVIDLADFLLSYNAIWYEINGFPVSMNTVKAIIFSMVIIREIWKQHTS